MRSSQFATEPRASLRAPLTVCASWIRVRMSPNEPNVKPRTADMGESGQELGGVRCECWGDEVMSTGRTREKLRLFEPTYSKGDGCLTAMAWPRTQPSLQASYRNEAVLLKSNCGRLGQH